MGLRVERGQRHAHYLKGGLLELSRLKGRLGISLVKASSVGVNWMEDLRATVENRMSLRFLLWAARGVLAPTGETGGRSGGSALWRRRRPGPT